MIDHIRLVSIIQEIAVVIKENKELLTELDQAIGDGDHGINLDRGFSAVKEKLNGLQNKDCGTILNTTAMTLISKVGGASGPLYGTAFMRAGQIVAGKTQITEEDAVKMFDAAIQGIVLRGKANKGDKTMLDALIPAFEIFKTTIEANEGLNTAATKAAEAAKEGVEYTKTIAAKKGRASYLGDRSIGHQDPGATSTYLILKVVSDFLAKEN
ncbi:dihydroxyacetone kinase DhaL subunit [Natronincola peptidivorans]|uniref:phosphoenolpyruvate--glycerone phosphotransferase n=1 Tax=Natronincola peptidivorans TaxID=426128 RepID=A0A1I0G4K1_9FIRM|nr:dihydroxyacetone kinase subunit DhaL [Natronincola peptidivorans]SET65563.1 dihydroxyacetone kinase DhaL subunit [Natronincola peptidivorans]